MTVRCLNPRDPLFRTDGARVMVLWSDELSSSRALSARFHRGPYLADDAPHPANSAERYFDIVFSLLGLLVCLPVLAIAMLAIKLENPRAGVLFRQPRFGYRGQPFTIIKLRTMVPDAELQQVRTHFAQRRPGSRISDFWMIRE